MRRRPSLVPGLVAICLTLGILTGCGDNRPLNYRALVLAMGFAPAPHHRLTVYLQIPTPRGLTSLSTGGAGNSGATTYTLHATGSTVGRALSRAQAGVNQELYLGQLQAVILSTHLNATQFADVASTFTRLGTLVKTAYALATPAPMATVFATTAPSTPIAPLYFATEFGCAHCQTVNLKREIWNIEQAQYGPPVRTLWLPLIEPSPQGFRTNTVALYQQDQVVRHLTARQTVLLGYLLGRTSTGTVHLVWDGLPVSIRALRAHAHFRRQWRGSTLTVHVTLSVVGNLDAFPASLPLDPHLTWVRTATADDLDAETGALATQLAHAGLDPWTLGQAAAWQHPDAVADWQQAYRQSRWMVTAHVHLREIGDTT